MGPSRRRGASKAAAAAAARRQWKVGDLVLAKVKGFPAWPATVSEPKEWGYKSDTRKVLVYFFGTQQIAFCNPIDVEPFTEEKKESILIKRPGRSADFLRAAQEIVDCFEKLKEQGRVKGVDSVEVAAENSTVSSADVKSSVLSTATPISRLNNSDVATEKTEVREPCPPIGDAAGSEDVKASQDAEDHGEPSKECSDPQKALSSTSRACRTRSAQPQALQQAKSSARSSRCSLKSDSSHIDDGIGSSNNHSGCANKGAKDESLDRFKRRNKRKRQNLSPLVQNAEELTACKSNDFVDDNNSESSMAYSDTFSNNGDSAVDSNIRLKQSEFPNKSSAGVDPITKGLEFHMETVITRKKRNPGRKRSTIDAAESAARPDAKMVTCTENLPPTEERSLKEEGDEHLPLVKRARVRMGKPSSMHEDPEAFMQSEEKPSDVSAQLPREGNNTKMDCEKDDGPEKCSLNGKDSSAYSSSSDGSPVFSEGKYQVSNARKGQAPGCSYDGEAALPPSKRLHRALEAMSANAAPEDRPSLVASVCVEENIGGCDNGSSKVSPRIVSGQEANQLECGDDDSCDDANKSSPNPALFDGHVSNEHSIATSLVEDLEKTETDCKHDVTREGMDFPPTKTHDCATKASDSLVGESCPLRSLGISDGEDEKAGVCASTAKYCNQSDHSTGSELKSDFMSGDIADGSKESENSKFIDIWKRENGDSGAPHNLELSTEEKVQVIGVCDAVNDTACTPAVVGPSSPALDVVATSPHLCSLASVSVSKSRDKVNLNPPTGEETIFRTVSPPTASVVGKVDVVQCNDMSTLGAQNKKSASGHDRHIKCESEISCSATAKSINKSGDSAEVKAAIASLEAALGTLTRTKESIGRATRIAMDCAKFGIAAEVVKILARYLEKESCLYKRVDLFFLVDSIAQCSRGLRGTVCDAYTSAIQATLPRLLSAAAPGGYAAKENRRQCLKVLKVWQDRSVLPDSIIRQHIRDLDAHGSKSSTSGYSHRMSRTERSFDDPIREMEGMLVDEYGSNSSFQLPGFCMPRMVKVEDDGSDSDEGSFEAVTPEHETSIPEKSEASDLPAMEKHRHILEDVDGELEMEDVAPSCEVETRRSVSPTGTDTAHASDPREQSLTSFPPLPKSPPPLPPPPPPPHLVLPPPPPPPPLPSPSEPPMSYPSTISHAGVDSRSHIHRNDVQKAMPPHPNAPRNTSQMHIPDSSTSCSYNSYPAAHNSVRPGNDSCQPDSTFHHNSYHLRPPSTASSNHYSYFQAEHRVGPQRDPPGPSYGDRSRFSAASENGRYYNDHERSRSGSHEYPDNWRNSRPSYHGSHRSDRSRNYSAEYSDPYRERNRFHNHGWGYRPRSIHHRYNHHGHNRGFSEGPTPVEIRAPGFWPPR